jgi:hypothetical protein
LAGPLTGFAVVSLAEELGVAVVIGLSPPLATADARDVQHVADLAEERAQIAKAIAAFAQLADRLERDGDRASPAMVATTGGLSVSHSLRAG